MLIVCSVAGAMVIEDPGARLAWSVVGLAFAASVLDGLDGWIARRYDEQSSFGARFDMEVDAALILVLAVLAYRWDRAGLWILLAGLMRYVFVVGASVLPWLARPLPPSERRRIVCVVQTVALIGCLMPWWPSIAAQLIALMGLLALTISFTIDVRFLYRERSRNVC